MPVGRVKWYDKTKGFGFIESSEGDVFFHFSDIHMEGFKALAEDQRVEYAVERSDRGLKAMDIYPKDTRASVRHAARYRTLIYMQVTEGCEEDFDEFFTDIPAWFDSMEQDMGMRRIGTWRTGLSAVHLIESEAPYDRAIEGVEESSSKRKYARWQKELADLLDDGPTVMAPAQLDDEEWEDDYDDEDEDEIDVDADEVDADDEDADEVEVEEDK